MNKKILHSELEVFLHEIGPTLTETAELEVKNIEAVNERLEIRNFVEVNKEQKLIYATLKDSIINGNE